MAGPFDVQRVPRGLLDALNMRGGGQTPKMLAQELAGSFELRELYAQDNRIQVDALGGAPAAGFNTSGTATVPAGELWVVTHLGVFVSNGVGVSITLAPAYQVNATSAFSRTVGAYTTIGASVIVQVGQQFGFGELVLLPGMQAGYFAHSITGVPTTIGIKLDAHRFLL